MKLGILFGVFAGMLWGTIFLIPRFLSEFSPLLLTCARFLLYGIISAALIIPFAGKIIPKITKKDLLTLTKFALAGNILYFIMLVMAVQLIGIAPSSLIVGLIPLTATIFGHTKESPNLRTLIPPLTMVFVGLICINADLFTQTYNKTDTLSGLLAAFGALGLWSWYAIKNAQYLKNETRFNATEWALLFGVITGALTAILAVILLISPINLIPQDDISNERWLYFILLSLWLAAGASWLGNICWNVASKQLPATLFGQMIIFETVFALFYGFAYEWRLPRTFETAAIILLITGVYWSMKKHHTRG